jgi:hypothetical protein
MVFNMVNTLRYTYRKIFGTSHVEKLDHFLDGKPWVFNYDWGVPEAGVYPQNNER